MPNHNTWVEAFCGSASITLAKCPAPIEIINDLDSQIVNAFEQIRNNSEALCRAIALTPYSRAEFYKAKEQELATDNLEKARRFLVATMMTINGTNRGRSGFSFSNSFTRSHMEARVSRWYNLPKRLAAIVERLRNVRVENLDAIKLLTMFTDRPATLVYLDPPYLGERSHKYVIDSSDEAFHAKLLNMCCSARCMILISGYDSSLYRSILKREKGWETKVIETNTRVTTGKDHKRSEVLWMNKQFIEANKSDQVPIKLTTKEKKDKKINPLRK